MIKDLVSIIEEEIKVNINKMYSNMSFLDEYTEKKDSKNEDLFKDLKIVKKSKNQHGFLSYKKPPKNIEHTDIFLVTEIKKIKVKVYIGYFENLNTEDIEDEIIKEVESRFKKREAIYDFLERNNIIIKAYSRKIFRNQLNNFLGSNETANIKF